MILRHSAGEPPQPLVRPANLDKWGVHRLGGVFLDLPETGEDHWHEIAAILAEAYRCVAPRGLAPQA